MATDANAFSQIRSASAPDKQLPAKQMKYGGQVVWLIDPTDDEMKKSAHWLHGKRVASGDGEKSVIVSGLTPGWPELSEKSDNIRLYVVAHGVKTGTLAKPVFKIKVASPLSQTNVRSASQFFDMLRVLIEKSPARRVRRIGLSVCNAGGLNPEIPPANSFAKELADLCLNLTVDITARQGAMIVQGSAREKIQVDRISMPHANPLYTIMRGATEFSVLNAQKRTVVGTQDYHNFRTYIFVPGQPPQLKPGNTE